MAWLVVSLYEASNVFYLHCILCLGLWIFILNNEYSWFKIWGVTNYQHTLFVSFSSYSCKIDRIVYIRCPSSQRYLLVRICSFRSSHPFSRGISLAIEVYLNNYSLCKPSTSVMREGRIWRVKYFWERETIRR